MTLIFADTSYWIALLNSRDQLHAKVLTVLRGLPSARIVTSEMVLTEFLNSVSDDGYLRDAAAEVVDGVRDNGSVTIVAQTAQQFDSALQRYKKSSDKAWSLTDCASFLIMEDRKIRTALTHDRHFAQAGFEALLR